MANWCSNYVSFSGSEENVKNFVEEVKALEALSKEKQEGVRPDENVGFMFDFQTYDLEEGNFSFESRWSPTIDSLEFLGRKHSVDMECDFEELGCEIFGRWSYDAESDTANVVTLTSEEIELCDEDEDSGACLFEGEVYSCGSEVFELILERKIKQINNHE